LIAVRVIACGVRGPGLTGWAAAAPILAGQADYVPATSIEPAPALLPANERRRLSDPARWALAAGDEALAAGALAGSDVATVFASCGSDGKITQQICEALAAPAREVSPTRFHNAVHNAPAGYWSIAMATHAPSTSLCAGAGSFGAGLLEAAAQAMVEMRPVLLIAYDLPYPEPLCALWSIPESFAVAILLGPDESRSSGPRVRIGLGAGKPDDTWLPGLPRELARNPAALAVPFLAQIARGGDGRLVLPYLDRCSIELEVTA
jgi:hypothetical protein